MDSLQLPCTPGSTNDILHPFNVFCVCRAVVGHAVSSLNPDTAVVRRVHHPQHRTRSHTGGGTESRGGAETASVASSRGSRRSNVSVTADGEAGALLSRPSEGHRRHRTHSGASGVERVTLPSSHQPHRRHRTSSQESEEAAAVNLSVASSSSAARRTRSAEEPLMAARRAAAESATGSGSGSSRGLAGETRPGTVRRSHSDGVRGRTGRREREDGGSGRVSPRLSTPRSLSPAATAAAASGLTPPLAPPPAVTQHGLGKPPLSARQRSSAPAGGGEDGAHATSRHRHHRASSGGGGGGGLSSSGRSSRSRHGSSRSTGERHGDDDDEEGGSVIVIRDGAVSGLSGIASGWPFFASSPTSPEGAKAASAFSWSPLPWWHRFRLRKMTRPAYLINHVLRAVPVLAVHYCCELKRQLATLSLLHFSDLYVARGTGGASAAATASVPAPPTSSPAHADGLFRPAATSTHHEKRAASSAWPSSEDAFAAASPSSVGHLLLTRWILEAVESYVEKLFFLDESLVVRQLRSRRPTRRMLGWTLRLVSHTVFDPFFLSVAVPLSVSSPLSPSSAPGSDNAPRVLFTVPGMLRGLGVSAASVVVQWLVMPAVSRLVDRAVLTVFEVVEYLIMRRYAHWSDDEEEEEDEEDGFDDNYNDDGASQASGVSDGARSLSQQSVSGAAANPAATAEERVRREQRQLRRARRERRRRRERRQAARDHAMRMAILRAIIYRVVASVAAQSLVDHPLSVLVELLRGRATLHWTGLLAPYAAMTAESDGISWQNLRRYASKLFIDAPQDGDGVPPVVAVLRNVGRDMTREVLTISASVLRASGQQDAIAAVERRAAEAVAQGGIPTAADSAEFFARSALSLSPFYHGVQFTVVDVVLSFYMAVWTRLTKQ